MNVQIYRLGSLGDTVVALPCSYKIAASFPQSKRALLTDMPVSVKAAPAELVLAGTGLIDSVISYPQEIRDPAALMTLIKQLRAFRFDAAIYMTLPRGRLSLLRDYLFLKACRVKKIYGIPFQSDVYFNRRNAAGVLERESERLVRSLRALGPVDL